MDLAFGIAASGIRFEADSVVSYLDNLKRSMWFFIA